MNRWILAVAGIVFAFLAFLCLDTGPAKADGVFTVTTTLDNDILDHDLSLREAILVSQGVLTTNLSVWEQDLLGGCTFSASAITGGCGHGFTDTIHFQFLSGTITLTSALPNLAADFRPTIVHSTNNTTQEIAIDASKLSTNTVPFRIYNDDNRIWHLTFRNARADSLRIYGDHNEIAYSHFYGNTGVGVLISGGDRNHLDMNDFGFHWLDTLPACLSSTRNGVTNVLVTGGAVSNTIEYNSITCSLGDGIVISGTTTAQNVIDNNYIGTYYKAGGLYHLPNRGAGVLIANGSTTNTVQYNVVGFNEQHGVRITGSGSDANTVYDNDIGQLLLAKIANDGAGVAIDGGASYNQILTNSIQNSLVAGVMLSGTNTERNVLQGNTIKKQPSSGVLVEQGAQLNTIAANTITSNTYGVLFDGSSTNFNMITRTLIYSNAYDGIAERNGATANFWSEISTYGNGGLGIDKNVTSDTGNVVDPPNFRITSVDRAGKVVSGVSAANPLYSLVTVELYRVALDPSGFGEGITFVGRTATNASGNWSIYDPGMSSGCYTAHVSLIIVFVPLGSTEFSRSNCSDYIPVVRK